MSGSVSKAIAGAVYAGIAAITAAAVDGSVAGWDYLVIAGAIGAGYLGVYAAPKNRHTERARLPRRRRRRRR